MHRFYYHRYSVMDFSDKLWLSWVLNTEKCEARIKKHAKKNKFLFFCLQNPIFWKVFRIAFRMDFRSKKFGKDKLLFSFCLPHFSWEFLEIFKNERWFFFVFQWEKSKTSQFSKTPKFLGKIMKKNVALHSIFLS